MIFNARKSLLLLAYLLCAATPALASTALALDQPASCKAPDFPKRALKANEEGVSMIGFLVRADGTVADTAILSSSGSHTIDRLAASALSRCVFQRAVNVDKAVDVWVRSWYAWHRTDDPQMDRAKRTAALAASKGNAAAHYHLSLLLNPTISGDEDRIKAIVMLRSAAELGHPHAQFDLGRRYELGDGVEMKLEEALGWYRKAAAQGDPLAQQRLNLGLLPN